MKSPSDYFMTLSDSDLLDMFNEIEKLNKTGILPDGATKTIRNQLRKDFKEEYGISWIRQEVHYEISKRWALNQRNLKGK